MAAEKRFEECLKRWLESEGIYALGTPQQEMTVPPCGYYEKRWGGGKFVKAGLPDMHIVVKGISIEAELKAPDGVVSDLQMQKLRQIYAAGCEAFVLRPADFEWFKNFIRGLKEVKFNVGSGTNRDAVLRDICCHVLSSAGKVIKNA